MELFGGHDAPLVVVDYAHTPDALDKTLTALRPWPRRAGQALVRVRLRRRPRRHQAPADGRVAERLADEVVLTSDNPRSEDPRDILEADRRRHERPPAPR
jgi:UDP-N-acetylmuramoyl-L-alanyl-D-glutamate--2,6-diaminopimelate ligase